MFDFLGKNKQKTKTVFCLLLVVATVFFSFFSSISPKRVDAISGYWTDYASSSLGYYYDSEVKNYVYSISSAQDLALVAKQINNGEQSWRSRYYKLKANIDLSDHYWVPIAKEWSSGSTYYYFKGTFDGDGYTISGLNVARNDSSTDHARVGLFGNVGTAIIKNLVIARADTWGNRRSGALAGTFQSSTVQDCIVRNSTIRGYNPGGVCYVGGFFGTVYYSDIKRCWAVDNTVEAHDTSGNALYAGGIVGKVWGDTETGTMATIDTCCTSGGDIYTVTYEENDAYAGGIAAVLNFTSVNKCYNTATVCAGLTTDGTDVAIAGAGGITGWMEGSASITNCYNTGTIASNAKINYGSVTNLSVTGADVEVIDVEVDKKGNVSFGRDTAYIRDTSVSSKGNGAYKNSENLTYGQPFSRGAFSGGIAGRCLSGSMIANCYNTGTVTGGNYSQYYRVGAKLGWKSGWGNIQFRRKIISHLSYTLTSYAGGITGLNEGYVSNCYRNNEYYSTLDAYQLIYDEDGGEKRTNFGSTCGWGNVISLEKSVYQHGFAYALGYSNSYYNYYLYYAKDDDSGKYLHDTTMIASGYCLCLDIDLRAKSTINFRYMVCGNGTTIFASVEDRGFIITEESKNYKIYAGNYYSISTGLAADGYLGTAGTYRALSDMRGSSDFASKLNGDVFAYSSGKNSGYPVIKDFYWDLNTEVPQ